MASVYAPEDGKHVMQLTYMSTKCAGNTSRSMLHLI